MDISKVAKLILKNEKELKQSENKYNKLREELNHKIWNEDDEGKFDIEYEMLVLSQKKANAKSRIKLLKGS